MSYGTHLRTWSAGAGRRTSSTAQPRRGSKSADSSVMVADALMSELKYQMRTAQQRHQAMTEKERRSKMEVDYSWLAVKSTSVERRQYEMPEMERIELEQLCCRLHPSDCGSVILSFRRTLDDQNTTNAQLLPQILRSTVLSVLGGRSADHVIQNRPIRDRVTKSLSNLRLRPSSRVTVAPARIHESPVDVVSASDVTHATASASLSNSTGSDVDICHVFTTSTRSHSMLALNVDNS